MEQISRDQLLWAIADTDRATAPVVPMDSLLLRYRRRQLASDERRRIEALLAESATARDRLRRLAEPNLSRPPTALRDHLLSQARRPRQRTPVLVALAASVLLAVASWQISGLWVSHPSAPVPVPGNAAFTLVVDGGFTERRGPAEGASSNQRITSTFVGADSRLAFSLLPETEQAHEFFYGLYRITNNRLERVHDDLVIRLEGGGARFEIDAVHLLTTGSDESRVLLAVGAGDLPERIELVRGQGPADTLEQQGLRQAYPHILKWVPELGSSSSD